VTRGRAFALVYGALVLVFLLWIAYSIMKGPA
jgi:hypothetical protein